MEIGGFNTLKQQALDKKERMKIKQQEIEGIKMEMEKLKNMNDNLAETIIEQKREILQLLNIKRKYELELMMSRENEMEEEQDKDNDYETEIEDINSTQSVFDNHNTLSFSSLSSL